MKKVIINLSLIGLGIVGTLSIQTYLPCTEDATTTASDSTVVDTLKVITEVSPVVSDTAKVDSTKK